MGIRFIQTLIIHVGSIQSAYSNEKRRQTPVFDLLLCCRGSVSALKCREIDAETVRRTLTHHYFYQSEMTNGPAYLLNSIEQRYDHPSRQ